MDQENQPINEFNQSTNSTFENQNNSPKPENNLVLSIIGTILGVCSPCCIGFIVGIVAIVFATQVNTKYDAGDYAGAEKAAKNTKILAYIALGLGVLGIIINIIALVTGGMDAYMDQYQSILDNAGGGSIDD